MLNKLTRICNNKERYYSIFLYQNLFGYFCIERIYGASLNKKPTGVIREFFNEADEAKKRYSAIMKAKTSKGYILKHCI
jgi:predicted DNA-binding WGR domain protein